VGCVGLSGRKAEASAPVACAPGSSKILVIRHTVIRHTVIRHTVIRHTVNHALAPELATDDASLGPPRIERECVCE
jgi:hypothetical protein